MSNNTALILSGSGYELSIAPEAEAQKTEIIKDAALIVEVRDTPSSDAARNQIKKLAAMRNLVEKSRKDVKEPVLAIGRDIDAKAKAFVTEIESEEKRLTKLVGDHAAEVERERQRVMREMEEKRRKEEAERARIEAERIAAEKAAEEAKRAANAAFLAEDDDAAEKAEQAAKEAAEAAAKAAAEAEAAKTTVTVPFFAPEKPAGVKFVPDFEVENVHALYAYSSALVTLEPKRSDILALIKQLTDGDTLPTIPGLRVFNKPAVSTR